MAASLALTTTSLLNALGSSPQKNIDVIVCSTAELAKCDCAAYGCIQAATGDLRFRAALIIPLFSQDAFYGCIGLECGRGPKAWVPEDVLILQTAAEIMMRCIENRQLTQELVASKTLDLQKANERLSAEVAAHRKSLADLKHREAELADRNKTFTELSALHKTKSSFAYRCLTPMEIQVANLVKQGKTNKGIAELLNLSRRTVEVHRYNIRKKLQVEKSRTNLKTYLSSME